MAYTIPVAALILDHAAAAAAINESPDYFDTPGNYDRWKGVMTLETLTGAPVESFSDENQEIFYVGLRITDDWRIDIDPSLLGKANALKAQHPHPLVQSATLAVVSEFC